MTTKEFNTKFKAICLNYGGQQIESKFIFDTPFGKMQAIANPSPINSIYIRFLEDFDVSFFYKYFSKNEVFNSFSKKWNIHNTNAEYVLDEFEERINNLNYILERDGKVCGKEFKPFLEEIFGN